MCKYSNALFLCLFMTGAVVTSAEHYHLSPREDTLKSAVGVPIYYRYISPDTQPAAIVLYIHGLCGHGGRHGRLFGTFVDRGFAVYAPDLRGHGRSGGQRGYINRWEEYRNDAALVFDMIGKEHPQTPVFLAGYSLGGLIAADYAIRFPGKLQGVVLMSAALGDVGVAPPLLFLARILSRIWPTFHMSPGMDEFGISRDTSVVIALQNDPLHHGQGTARLGTEFMNTVSWVNENAGSLRVPLLVQHGTADRIASPQSAQQFFNKAGARDKKIRLYDGAYHELDNDLCAEEVCEEIATWIERRANKERFSTGDGQ